MLLIKTYLEEVPEAFESLLHREAKRIEKHLVRSRGAQTDATLTLGEWLLICHRHNWCCPFCKGGAMETIEHVIPVCDGGGTTKYNCVPCCKRCNQERNRMQTQTKVMLRKNLQIFEGRV